MEGGIEKRNRKKKHLELAFGSFMLTGFITRKIGASKELSRKEREAEERENGIGGGYDDGDDDEYNDDGDGMDI